MNNMICPHCDYNPPREKLYSMADSFSIYNDTYLLKCLQCKRKFIVGYTEYYAEIEGRK